MKIDAWDTLDPCMNKPVYTRSTTCAQVKYIPELLRWLGLGALGSYKGLAMYVQKLHNFHTGSNV